MTRRVGEVVDVRCAPGQSVLGDEPEAFIWRGRLYVVRDVVGQWHQRRAWWRETDLAGAQEASLDEVVWRVEASAGRAAGAGVYDLVHLDGPGEDEGGAGTAAGVWRLARVQD